MRCKGDYFTRISQELARTNDVDYLCPFMINSKSAVVHNDARTSRMTFNGLNKWWDNDITINNPYFMPCLGEQCMAFDSKSFSCKLCGEPKETVKKSSR